MVHALYNAALNDIGLPAEKVAELEKLQPERKRDESRMEAAKSRQAAMIAGIEAGKLDSAKFDEDKSAMEKKMAEQKEAQQKLLGDLHAALDPAQRKAAVDAVKKQHAARDERMAQKKAEGDKATVRVLMSHEMETGQRKDSSGKPIPAWFIQEVTVAHNGA
ncbi:MAG TPA: thiosulfate oxidation carrier complex protein SoxZ, partial [Polyangiaceae bacterium]|nr:thiosulfate oxidation carrier complex protein SoxZ [Polyangiaceae bacterium]